MITKLKCAAGLAELATKKYKSAAKYFLQASFDYCDFPEVYSESYFKSVFCDFLWYSPFGEITMNFIVFIGLSVYYIKRSTSEDNRKFKLFLVWGCDKN